MRAPLSLALLLGILVAPAAAAQVPSLVSQTSVVLTMAPMEGDTGALNVTVVYYYTSLVAPLAEGSTRVDVSLTFDPALVAVEPAALTLEMPVEFSAQPAVLSSTASGIVRVACLAPEEVQVEAGAVAHPNGPYDGSEARNALPFDCGAAASRSSSAASSSPSGDVVLQPTDEPPARATPGLGLGALLAGLAAVAACRRRV